jgi:hypothetical protein
VLENFDFDSFLHDNTDPTFDNMTFGLPSDVQRWDNPFLTQPDGTEPVRAINTGLPPPSVNGMQRNLEIREVSQLLTRLQGILQVLLNRWGVEGSGQTSSNSAGHHPLVSALEQLRRSETRDSLGLARGPEWAADRENILDVIRGYMYAVTDVREDGVLPQYPRLPFDIAPEDTLSNGDITRAVHLISAIEDTWNERRNRQMASLPSLFTQPVKGLDSDDRPAEAATDEAMTAKLSCKICYCQVADTACLPCGHLSMCRWCADLTVPVRQEDKTRPVERGVKCPVCRSRVKSRVRIYVG